MKIMRTALTCLAALAALASCRSVGPPGVKLASSPPGARVVVDGSDTGFVTPCSVDLSKGRVRKVEFLLPGYETVTRILVSDSQSYYVPWKDGDVGIRTWRFPLWLDIPALITPVERNSGKFPTSLHVHLRRKGSS